MLLGFGLVSIQSCGSEDTGGVSVFKTVTAIATVDSTSNPLLADIATWTGTPCATGSTYAVTDKVVNFTIVSTKGSSGGTASPLMLQRATIAFSPADTLTQTFAPLPPLYSPAYQSLLGYTVPAGGSLVVPVEVVTHALKEFFGPTLVCTGNTSIYNYNVVITFDATEVTTGKNGQISAGMTVRFADFADK